jgi:RNA polymerase sigma-70 factor (ECF subfamily)
MGQNDEKWVQQAQKGSRKAFDKLIKEYTPLIFHLLYDITGSYQDAQDLTQEAFLRAYLKIKDYRGEAKFITWLYRIAYNRGIDFKRKTKKMMTIDLTSQQPASVFRHLIDKRNPWYTGEGEAIESALQKLTHQQRMSVILNYYHGFRMREIGEILGCSEATVRTHIFRALRRLREELKDYSPKG